MLGRDVPCVAAESAAGVGVRAWALGGGMVEEVAFFALSG